MRQTSWAHRIAPEWLPAATLAGANHSHPATNALFGGAELPTIGSKSRLHAASNDGGIPVALDLLDL